MKNLRKMGKEGKISILAESQTYDGVPPSKKPLQNPGDYRNAYDSGNGHAKRGLKFIPVHDSDGAVIKR